MTKSTVTSPCQLFTVSTDIFQQCSSVCFLVLFICKSLKFLQTTCNMPMSDSNAKKAHKVIFD